MNFFEAINHALTTMATGGYSTRLDSIGAFSVYSQYIIILFMFVAGINFSLSYFVINRKTKVLLKNEEFHFYLAFVIGFTFLSLLVLLFQLGRPFEKAFRDALFQVVSLITTTGFATDDYMTWNSFGIMLAFALLFFGGSAGSTRGGAKVVRIMILLKNASIEFKRLVHPNAAIPVRINNRAVKPEIITNVQAFVIFYIVTFVVGSAIMAALGLDIDSAMGAAITCLGNVGPGIGVLGRLKTFLQYPNLENGFCLF